MAQLPFLVCPSAFAPTCLDFLHYSSDDTPLGKRKLQRMIQGAFDQTHPSVILGVLAGRKHGYLFHARHMPDTYYLTSVETPRVASMDLSSLMPRNMLGHSKRRPKTSYYTSCEVLTHVKWTEEKFYSLKEIPIDVIGRHNL